MVRPKPTGSSLGVTPFTGPPCRSLGHAPDCLLGSIGPRLRPWGPNGPDQRANQPFTSCVGALCGVKTLQGAESKQGEEGSQKKKRAGSQVSEAKPAERMLRVPGLSGITAPPRCVCVTLPWPGMPFHTPSESDPAYWGKGTDNVGPKVHALLSLARSRLGEQLEHSGIGDLYR